MAHPGRPDRARDRRHRTADRLRRRRPARDHARRRRRGLRRALRRPARPRAVIFTNNDTHRRGRPRRCAAAGAEIVDARSTASVVATRWTGDRVAARRRPAASAAIAGRSPRDRSRPTCCSSPAAGTRTSRCGARPAARSASTSGSPRSSRTGRDRSGAWRRSVPPRATSRARRDRAVPGSCRRPTGRRRWSTHYVDLQRDATVTRPAPRARRRPDLDRARQALHDDRHGGRPGQDLGGRRRRRSRRRCSARRSARSACRPTARRRPGQLRPARRARPRRPRSTPSGRRRSTPGTSPHGAVFEDVGQWKRPRFFPRAGEIDGRRRPARVRAPRGPASRSWTPRRSARSTSRVPTPAPSSTASTRTRSRRSRSGRAATA